VLSQQFGVTHFSRWIDRQLNIYRYGRKENLASRSGKIGFLRTSTSGG